METLGLSGPPPQKDSLFRRLLWPSADSVDADILGQQGFWLCLILALGAGIISAFQGHIVFGVLFGVFYFLCGIGIREHDVPAAIAAAAVYLVNIGMEILIARHPPGWLTLLVALLLIANIRGCAIASRWAKAGDPDLIPIRLNQTWQDKLVDQMPAKVWPRFRVAFYVLSAMVFLLTLADRIATVMHPHAPPSNSPSVIVKG